MHTPDNIRGVLHPDIWQDRQVIAHRGSRILWPENTMLAFQQGLDAGADHLETDLRLTADGHVVCFHDSTLDRTTDGTGPVAALTLSELRRYDVGYRHQIEGDFPFRGKGLRAPTLGELLATFPEVGVVVDLKQDGLEDPLTALLDRMDAWDRVIAGSFSDQRLARLATASRGRVHRSAGPLGIRLWWAASRIGRTGPSGYSALQIPPTWGGFRVVDRRLVEAAHSAGLDVHVWTINQPDEMQAFWDLGVNAVITDRVDLAVTG